ncbi:mechanosensitive ion channel family protein [Ramlibacter humi]|uniref:Small-conductance mechanosensitive ion channel n=1 Tax=Ramlibacter humi TaxID=2530451 RepID=A0A4Z0CAX6_9BURK|nr:small-conductance mechanosensitive ion channel [Ramlibacter humi]TFZ08753.1 small-conductance mechanosensitive ion channel [Ramlibacter humi]
MPTAITDWGAAMMTSLAAALAMFLSAIPKIIGFAVILIVGWLLSSLIERGVAALLRAVRFNDLASRAGFTDFLSRMRVNTSSSELRDAGVAKAADPAGMIGLIAKWFVRLIALVVAFDALGLPAVSDVLRDLLLWLPNVVVALVVLVIGGLAARALSNLVRGASSEAGIEQSNLLAKIASVLVWAFAIVVAVNQIGIATTLVNTLFMAFVGAIALGLGLAFGLGGRETAGRILSRWYETSRDRGPQLAHAAEVAGDRAREQARGMAAQYPQGYQGGGMPAGSQQGGAPYQGQPTGQGARYEDPRYQGGAYQGGPSGGYTGGGGQMNPGYGQQGGSAYGNSTGGAQYPADGGPREESDRTREEREAQGYDTTLRRDR